MSDSYSLDFEKPIVDLENEIHRLRALVESGDFSHAVEVEKLSKRLDKVRADIFSNLTAYQRVKLSRHLDRPFTLDYIQAIIEDFVELHGDRVCGDDGAIVGGIGKFCDQSIVVIGHQRGRSTQERMLRNFGMPQPEGNRKAQRLFKLAEKFGFPLLLLIDTQGAYPGMEAEERGQAEAIARSLFVLAGLKVPIISVVIGEGGSGGALALGVCDRLLMLENSTYSVITPEGCASILWGKGESGSMASHAATAAESLKVTAKHLHELGIVDEIIVEPEGGAHKDKFRAADKLAEAASRHLREVSSLSVEEMLSRRHEKFRAIGSM